MAGFFCEINIIYIYKWDRQSKRYPEYIIAVKINPFHKSLLLAISLELKKLNNDIIFDNLHIFLMWILYSEVLMHIFYQALIKFDIETIY